MKIKKKTGGICESSRTRCLLFTFAGCEVVIMPGIDELKFGIHAAVWCS